MACASALDAHLLYILGGPPYERTTGARCLKLRLLVHSSSRKDTSSAPTQAGITKRKSPALR
eukprot:8760503-Pyramimonas_sp.AAC.1